MYVAHYSTCDVVRAFATMHVRVSGVCFAHSSLTESLGGHVLPADLLQDMTRGTLKGGDIYSVGDGCGSPQACIDAQKAFNAPGMSPFMCQLLVL
jgi:hypothetical protein